MFPRPKYHSNDLSLCPTHGCRPFSAGKDGGGQVERVIVNMKQTNITFTLDHHGTRQVHILVLSVMLLTVQLAGPVKVFFLPHTNL